MTTRTIKVLSASRFLIEKMPELPYRPPTSKLPFPPGKGKDLVALLDKYNFTEQDANDLDEVIKSHRQKLRP
jgi:hypothetical protein